MLVTSPEKSAAAMGEKIDAVLETLAFSDDTQIVLSKQPDGKFRAMSNSWDEGIAPCFVELGETGCRE